MKLDELIDKVNAAYEAFDYHIVFHAIHNFCVIDMSNFYLDILKDRLYCEGVDSASRRAAQTTIYRILSAISRLIAPIMSFTADEIWAYLPHSADENNESIFLNDMPEKSGIEVSDEFKAKWELVASIREDAKKALELKRADKVIGASLEANLKVFVDDDKFDDVSALTEELPSLLIVSAAEVCKDSANGEYKGDLEGVSFTVTKANGNKCERCWSYSDTVGKFEDHPTLCERCKNTIAE